MDQCFILSFSDETLKGGKFTFLQRRMVKMLFT